MSLLTACNNALGEIGLPTFTSIAGNVDQNAIQCLYLANRCGRDLAHSTRMAGYWQQLRKQYTFQTVGYGPYTCTITPNSTTLTNVSNTTGIVVGQNVYSTGLVNDTLVVAPGVVGSTVYISQAPTASTVLTGQGVVFAQEAYPLPSDFAYLIAQTEWDRNFRWQLLGPLDAQEWQVIKSGISPVGPRMRFRIMQGQFYINPVGSSSSVFTDTIAYEYVSNQWAVSAGGAGQTSYIADTDTTLIPENLITLGLKARFLQAKGLEWQPAWKEYEDTLDREIGRSASNRSLPLNARASGIRLLNSQNVPDSNFGS